ncbi:MAG: hypothetical protein HY677_01980 [Chloroflexi bacterium]|nr:hypothetical protein [Chloroflexota bacterium]
MDNDFGVNIGEVFRVIDAADVFVIGFSLFPERLLVDARTDAYEGPLVEVVGPASSVEDRLKNLRELRPRFPPPEKFTFFVWPKRIATMDRLGVWDRIRRRCDAFRQREMLEQCEKAFRQLEQLERGAMVSAVKGEGYQVIWASEKKS